MSQPSATYTLGLENNWIQCHLCGRVSYNRGDVENLYCGYCHHFHLDPCQGGNPFPGHRQHTVGSRLTAEARVVRGTSAGMGRKEAAAPSPVPNQFDVETDCNGDVLVRKILVRFPIILKPHQAMNLAAWLSVAVDPDGHQFELLVKQIKQT